MSNAPRRVGPDFFGYYSSEVVNLLSQDEDVLPVTTQLSELPQNNCGGGVKNLVNHSYDFSGPLYSNVVGAGLSDFEKDRLKSLLRQSAVTLSSEVDEVVGPVFTMYDLQSGLRSKTHSLSLATMTSDDALQIPSKKQKVSSPSSSARPGPHAQNSDVNPQSSMKVRSDLQFLLENDSVEVDKMVIKYSDELSGTLGYMEQELEILLDAVMSKCRPMALVEKQQLQRLIQRLPAENLDRVVEIICRSRPAEEQSCDKIFVDLEKEDNATLWRLYYYVEAVEKAKSLSCSEEMANPRAHESHSLPQMMSEFDHSDDNTNDRTTTSSVSRDTRKATNSYSSLPVTKMEFHFVLATSNIKIQILLYLR
ncbi:hypothetical protein KIW84_072832 [Lathyrus oleraceus]|uniref:NET domain-containing protein n=1 Tax=Pisum sativum TaxID=3888 RepID=A0A9D4VMA9_PEA|nr:hypothetical protein KIW84_072832 [Pisum sativum]